ncbi:hypothetical protein [Brachyspira murdochii]|uniref:Uncharacterized protein n=1 Tax=Brachyspira murdochii (strain ATCC 51284 / DSM 12563 / 56-150) TaxID=526224 RepID=D5U4V4_BRAM5|nr:hypothetical protein [Brachyspira murdochii]ADG71415.1 hypothetical protein Bmur_1325 [Brachyspira murdochii DSM 12563]ADG71795.1 hypothetical protein Bmur_1710 [Brachyspira murdochii DSM 12563]ADG72358.1 hypothetical protein Bmur_2285 [Brachyspira murdochii DSM 12563]
MLKGIFIKKYLININCISNIYFDENKKSIRIFTLDSGLPTTIECDSEDEYNKYYNVLSSLFDIVEI